MGKYKLTYFNVRARAELTRIIFSAAGVEFEDKRLEESEWPDFKPKTPYGQLPVLEIDGTMFAESACLARYAAREFGLDGKTNIEKLQTDIVVEQMVETRNTMFKNHFEKDEKKKEEEEKKFREETLPKILGYWESAIGKNADGEGFIVGTQVTWADFALMDFFDLVLKYNKELSEVFVTKYPNLAKNREKVQALPKIAAYLQARPDSKF